VNVSEGALAVNPEQMTPTVMISRQEIQATPGADLSNSFNMITDFVPGAWMTHDQLHAPIQSRPDCLSLFMNPTERGSSLPE
jgi:hypothetical protein